MSATCHWAAGKRARHSAISEGEESTPVSRKPRPISQRAIGRPEPQPMSSTPPAAGRSAAKRSSQAASSRASPPRSRSQAAALAS
jgi:hypothetical protein